MKTMSLRRLCDKLIYEKEVNTGYSEGFLRRVQHDQIKSYATRKQNLYESGIEGLELNWEDYDNTLEKIEKSKPLLWRDLTVTFDGHECISDEIKEGFMLKYWNQKIGSPTVEQFRSRMLYYFRIVAKNLLVQNYLLSTLTADDFLDNGKGHVTNNGNSDTVGHQGQADRPSDETLKYETAKDVLMSRANNYVKNVGSNKSTSDTVSDSTRGKYDAFLRAERTNNLNEILDGALTLFLLTKHL